jgi:hypothetical protein
MILWTYFIVTHIGACELLGVVECAPASPYTYYDTLVDKVAHVR